MVLSSGLDAKLKTIIMVLFWELTKLLLTQEVVLKRVVHVGLSCDFVVDGSVDVAWLLHLAKARQRRLLKEAAFTLKSGDIGEGCFGCVRC